MSTTISQRELRNNSGGILRALDQGQEFVITRNGVPVGELRPARRTFVGRAALVAAFAGAPPIDGARFRADLDTVADQDPEPRA